MRFYDIRYHKRELDIRLLITLISDTFEINFKCNYRICKTYVSIMKPHRQLYKRVVNVEYDSICGEQNLPCKKFRPEHRTFIKIVQRPTFVCKTDILDRP